MERRYLINPFADFSGGESTPFASDEEHIKNLICTYVDAILEHCHPNNDEEDLFRANPNLSAVRSYARGPVRTRAPVEHQQVRAPSLKEKLMGPPSANGETLV